MVVERLYNTEFWVSQLKTWTMVPFCRTKLLSAPCTLCRPWLNKLLSLLKGCYVVQNVEHWLGLWLAFHPTVSFKSKMAAGPHNRNFGGGCICLISLAFLKLRNFLLNVIINISMNKKGQLSFASLPSFKQNSAHALIPISNF